MEQLFNRFFLRMDVIRFANFQLILGCTRELHPQSVLYGVHVPTRPGTYAWGAGNFKSFSDFAKEIYMLLSVETFEASPDHNADIDVRLGFET